MVEVIPSLPYEIPCAGSQHEVLLVVCNLLSEEPVICNVHWTCTSLCYTEKVEVDRRSPWPAVRRTDATPTCSLVRGIPSPLRETSSPRFRVSLPPSFWLKLLRYHYWHLLATCRPVASPPKRQNGLPIATPSPILVQSVGGRIPKAWLGYPVCTTVDIGKIVTPKPL